MDLAISKTRRNDSSFPRVTGSLSGPWTDPFPLRTHFWLSSVHLTPPSSFFEWASQKTLTSYGTLRDTPPHTHTKARANLDSILKSRDITLLTKVRLVKAIVFPVVMYGCESWTIKKAEYRRIGAFELWCWRRLLRVPWTARRSNQSTLKEIIPEYSLEGLMLKLKL